MTTHANLLFSSQVYRDWIGIDASDVILGVAPLFHITGIVGHVGLSLLTGAPLVLTHRFDADDTVRAIARHGATFTVGSITVFIALMNAAEASRDNLASLTKIYSGGAPIPPATRRIPRDVRESDPQHLRPHRDHLTRRRRPVRRHRPARSRVGHDCRRRPRVRHGGPSHR